MARRKIWVPYISSPNAAASTNSLFAMLANLPGDHEALGGLTVSRVIGNVSFSPATIAKQAFAMFIAVMHEDQSQTNVAMNTESFPGVMWSWLGRSNGAFIETSSGVFTSVEERVYYDVRVQRKLPAQHQLVFVVMNEGGVQINVRIGGRALIALP